ncbi:MAG: PAS domain S-box protein, partial [Desulfomonile tiedjei]|nr:PAS domain S-box protein [Desulfomonile tiedjei]
MNQRELLEELESLRRKVEELEGARIRLEHTERALRDSEERFRLLYENAPLGYQSLDETGCVIEVNTAWLDTLGYTREEVIGKWIGDFLAPAYVERFKENFPKFKAAGEIHWVEFDMVRKDNSIISVAFDGQIGRDQWGRFRQTHCIMHDMTEIRRSQDALKESEERYRRIVETANEGIGAIDDEFRTTFVNQRMADMLGYPVEEMIGRRVDSFMFEEDLPDHSEKMNALLLGEGAVYERRFRGKDGGTIWTIVSETPLRDFTGNFVGSFAMFTDITERERADRALRESEDRFRALSEATFEAIFLSDKGICIGQNLSAEMMFGYSTEEALGRSGTGWIAPEYRELVLDKMLSGHEEPYEAVAVRKDGTKFPCEIQGRMIDYRGRRIRVTALRDITERRRAEDALRESKDAYRNLVENLDEVVFSTDAQGVLTYVSPSVERLLGYEPSELVGLDYASFLHQEDLADIGRKFQDVLENRIYPGEFRFRAKAGDFRWMRASGRPILKGDQVLGISGIAGDITGQKQAEEALRQSENRYRALFEHSPISLWEEDLSEVQKYLGGLSESGVHDFRQYFENHPESVSKCTRMARILDVNKTACEIFGASDKQELLRGLDSVFCDETYETMIEGLVSITEGIQEFQIESKCRTLGGEHLDIILKWAVMPGSEQTYSNVLVSVTDITDRKRAEQELRVERGILKDILEATLAGYWDWDIANNKEYLSPTFKKMFGYEDHELPNVPETWQRLMFPEDLQEVFACFDKHVSSRGQVPYYNEVRYRHKDGFAVWVICAGRVIEWDSSGNPLRMVGCHVDITERKRAEEALRRSEAMLRESQRVSAVGHYEFDVNSGFWTNSEMLDEIFGIGADYTRNVEGWEGIIHPECREEMLAYLRDYVLRDRNRFNKEYRIVRINDGVMRWVHGRGNLEADADGQLVRMFGTIQDISERKWAEESLRESEEKYRDLFDNSTDLIYTHRLDGYYTSVNNAARDLLGYSTDEFLKLNFRQIADPEYLNRTEENFRKKAEGEVSKTGPYELLVRTKDGSPVWVEVNSRIIMRDGMPVGVHGNARDITERKAAETERLRLVTAIEQAAEVVLITDPDGTIVYVNPAFEQITGYNRHEAIGCNPRILKSGLQDDSVYSDLWNTISDGRVWSGHFINKRKDGTLFEEEATISPVKDDSGRIVNYVAVKRDVSNEVLLQKQLLEAQKMEAVGTLAGGIAHDFNNLLQVINGYAEMALFEIKKGHPGHSELLEIKAAARSAAELTQGLLTFSRRVESKLRPVDLNQELANVAKLLTRTLPKMIKITMSLAEPLDTVNADPAQLQQVVMNLAVNARDAMPKGGKLLIETRNVLLDKEYCKSHLDTEPGHYVVLTISDNGIGMDEKTRRHIFDPFFTTKETGKGTGLGLSIVFGIIRSHGGNVICYSEPGQGTTFKIYLPAVTGEWVREIEEQHEILAGGTESILLIDDEDSVRRLGASILKRFGYSVITASNGKEGLESFTRAERQIDLVILDLVMPEMS